MNDKVYEFEAVIEAVPEKGGAYVRFPYDIRKEFGKGRVKVHAVFDGVPYEGSLVNMGVKNSDGSIIDSFGKVGRMHQIKLVSAGCIISKDVSCCFL